jgi:Calcineurin-like phosphoesterase
VRHLAVGDIHGCYRALVNLAAFVPFEPDDVVITLGDYVDRGPQSRDVLDWLIAFRQANQLVALRGNHDIIMMDACSAPWFMGNWFAMGGDATLRSYAKGEEEPAPEDVPVSHLRFLDEVCKPYFETATHFFVHANVNPKLPLNKQEETDLYWRKFDNPKPHVSGKTMICGHTAQASGWPLNAGHAVCLDTKVYATGWLTCLDVASGVFWQANEDGQTRQGDLADLPISA